jgi:hypothetical protein
MGRLDCAASSIETIYFDAELNANLTIHTVVNSEGLWQIHYLTPTLARAYGTEITGRA